MCPTPLWSEGDRYLLQNAPELAPLIAKYSPCTLQPKAEEEYFTILLSGIIAQQLSPEVSQQLVNRLTALVGNPITPEAVLAADKQALLATGISAKKLEYIQGFAEKIVNGSIDLQTLPAMADNAILKQLLEVHGLGQWTIEMFLLLALCRPDISPASDFIYKKQLQKLFQLPEIPKRGQINKLTAHWRPWRSLAVWYLWLQEGEQK